MCPYVSISYECPYTYASVSHAKFLPPFPPPFSRRVCALQQFETEMLGIGQRDSSHQECHRHVSVYECPLCPYMCPYVSNETALTKNVTGMCPYMSALCVLICVLMCPTRQLSPRMSPACIRDVLICALFVLICVLILYVSLWRGFS
jgi:hypothetical protein